MTHHLTDASAAASQHATRHGEWVANMERLTLAEVEFDLEALQFLPREDRASSAITIIETAARRLEALGRGRA